MNSKINGKQKFIGTKVLGISAFYHDSAAALLVNGEIVAAAQEETVHAEKTRSPFSD